MQPYDTNAALAKLRSRSSLFSPQPSELDRLLSQLRTAAQQGLHLGCGATHLDGMINCDLFHPDADLKIDATDLSGFADGSVDMIETHHMLEHFSIKEAPLALAEWHRALAPGGILVLSCPDLTKVCMKWLMYSLSYPFTRFNKKLADIVDGTRDYIIRMFVGPQDYEGMLHKSAYDKHQLRRLVEASRFEVISLTSGYPARPTPSLFLIARKPAA